MRMRKKKNLEPRMAACGAYLIARPEESRGRWREMLGRPGPLALEIGCGKGRFIVELARRNPDVNYVALERVESVLLLAMEKAKGAGLCNLRFISADAAKLDEFFAPGEVDRLYLNFSDPWPQNRHAKRRLTHERKLALYDQVLAADAELEMKTDNEGLFTYSICSISRFGMVLEDVCLDLHARDREPVMTEYEANFSAKGMKIYYLKAKKRPHLLRSGAAGEYDRGNKIQGGTQPMKVFISADIEGVTTTTTHDDCRSDNKNYPYHCEQMTSEVVAACEGAIKAGATEIVIKDAHGPANNIDIKRLPKCARVIRNWSGHPFSMVEGVDETFDAIMFVGYHNAASRDGNPMSHTVSGRPAWIKMNGRIVSEFMMFSMCAASVGVPTVYLAGDKQLCEDYADLHPCLVSTAVKEGFGSRTLSLSPALAVDMIREDAERALRQDFRGKVMKMPEQFDVEICYNHHTVATKNSFYPGAKKTGDCTIAFSSSDYFEIMRFFKFVL